MHPLLLGLLVAAHARFVPHTIAADLKGGYQVVVADLNQDGKPDLIALASGMDSLVWYENPSWTRHVIARGFTGMINCAALDLDGDGIPEIVVASGFKGPGEPSSGILTLLHHDGDPRGPWTSMEIGRLPMSHRLRWADLEGGGKPVLVDAPLTAAKAQPPQFTGVVPLVYYDPQTWKRHTINSDSHGLVHGLFILDWDGDGRDEILTAGFDGIHLLKWNAAGWKRVQLSSENSSDIAVGKLGKRRFLCAIEPWHGNRVAVYRQRGNAWERSVIDDSLADGHTILAADLDGNGRDRIIAGFRGGKRSVYIYSAEDAKGARWSRDILDDGGMPAAACAIADLNGDERLDIACIGSSNATLKWYENTR